MAAVYVSSTFVDLKRHRTAVRDTLRRLGHLDIAMEYYVAENRRPQAKCLNDVTSADLYLGIFAWRYGYVPPGSTLSITEQEFRQALRCEREMLLFLVDPQAPWPESLKEHGRGERRLQSLCKELRQEFIVDYFSSPSDLSAKVAVALAKWAGPMRTPQEVEREHRLLRTWLYAEQGAEREQARQALRNMASTRYISVLKQYLIEERGNDADLASCLSDIVSICGPTLETIAVLRDLIWNARYDLKCMAVFQIGELWLSGRKPTSEFLKMLPEIAATGEPRLLNALVHAVEKLIRVHRLAETRKIPREITECLEIMVKVPRNVRHDPSRSQRSLDALLQRSKQGRVSA